MRKETIIINGVATLVASELLEDKILTDEDGNEIGRVKYPKDCYMDTMTDGKYLKDDTKILTKSQDDFRKDRNELLAEVDLYQLVLRWNSLTSEQQTELTDYRQALLDATLDWIMPDKPTFME